ncbi:MAG: UDP-N-acetylmuramate:L-alanyl-gamma-D-glutamyl-meso-diaminopimelate ligase [Gammaproteobacteria bacterium]|nr:UDP-N-acetylmuramate:L-alanyl-gamma-D-glutamyl-meso-diaminopimelate ligase [Gammaproteobacteria bacterium]NNJ51315.1 UDP-N-acetylmuramate:L-alanyl-gamma-D-glutamyl-meso-diaminopimelate ligase [Gammaproteobacteria bacterium]
MKIHILGICGTFMGGIALLAKQEGHEVSGCDANVYPPMSTQLEEQGITLCEGFEPDDIPEDVDEVVIGNAMSRGNAAVEYVLNNNISYSSGPEWLSKHILKQRWVLAVAGTHGKTTTSSMLAWILQYADLNPGFLIGGIPANFGLSARAGEAPFFVVEADEYDTAFFDKRSKFIHYHPRTAVLNNLEFDHADIFDDLDAIKKQFHHFVRTIPGDGLIIKNGEDDNVSSVLDMGCWSQVAAIHKDHDPAHSDDDWSVGEASEDGRQFEVLLDGKVVTEVNWSLHGAYNRMNALAAIAAAQHAGVPVEVSCEALGEFRGIKRRLEIRGVVSGVTVYDDFAHHPTAIAETLAAMKEVKGEGRVFAVLEPRSNTMRMGVHKESLGASWQQADEICLYQPQGLDWNLDDVVSQSETPAAVYSSTANIIDYLVSRVNEGDHILIMSNGGFEGIHQRMLDALAS